MGLKTFPILRSISGPIQPVSSGRGASEKGIFSVVMSFAVLYRKIRLANSAKRALISAPRTEPSRHLQSNIVSEFHNRTKFTSLQNLSLVHQALILKMLLEKYIDHLGIQIAILFLTKSMALVERVHKPNILTGPSHCRNDLTRL